MRHTQNNFNQHEQKKDKYKFVLKLKITEILLRNKLKKLNSIEGRQFWKQKLE